LSLRLNKRVAQRAAWALREIFFALSKIYGRVLELIL